LNALFNTTFHGKASTASLAQYASASHTLLINHLFFTASSTTLAFRNADGNLTADHPTANEPILPTISSALFHK
jgi:hypothetical protein